ncbi:MULTISPECIES: hypothetical protein, partial [unclassified Mameliella]|uniref:hypothetical protein n=1 Tax=unclassified Mameliella TaxID=2630630 RepID=UPI00273F2B92
RPVVRLSAAGEGAFTVTNPNPQAVFWQDRQKIQNFSQDAVIYIFFSRTQQQTSDQERRMTAEKALSPDLDSLPGDSKHALSLAPPQSGTSPSWQ